MIRGLHMRGGPTRRRVVRALLAIAILLLVGLGLYTTQLTTWSGSRESPLSARSVTSRGDATRDYAGGEESPVPQPDRQATKVRRLVVRDLFNAETLPFLELAVETREGSVHSLRTNREGMVEVQERLVQEASRWRCLVRGRRVASNCEQVRVEGVVWCVGYARVQGRVILAPHSGALPRPEIEEVCLSFSPEFASADDLSPRTPGKSIWTTDSALSDELTRTSHPDAMGAFLLDVPVLNGGAIVARATGWRPAWEVLDDAAFRGAREVLLVLEPGLRIEGALRGERGTPLAGERVHIYVVIRSRVAEFDYASVNRVRNGGFTLMRSQKKDLVVQTLHYWVDTDAVGRWSVDIGADGEAYVVSRPAGHAPVQQALGRASEQLHPVNLSVAEKIADRVRICRDGRGLSNRRLLFIDLSQIDVQSSFRALTDADGWITTSHLVQGVPYSVVVVGEGSVYLTYEGRRAIELAGCETNLDAFLGNR